MSFTNLQPTSVNGSATFTFANLVVNSTSQLGAIGNLKITGGTSGQAIVTDGAGNLSFSTISGGGGGSVTLAGSNTQIQYNNNGNLGASANLTFDFSTNTFSTINLLLSGNANLGNLATANYFQGDGGLVSNITGANVSGTVSLATSAGTVTATSQPNISSVGTLSNLHVTGNISTAANLTAAYIIGNGSQLTGLPATYSNTNVAAYLVANPQPGTYTNTNVSSYIGTFTGSIAAGNATLGNLVVANYFSGSGNLLSNIQGSNVTGTVPNATTSGTVIAATQSNITALGTLSRLNVTGNISSAANVTASYHIGNGSALTSLTGANVTGQVANANIADQVYTNAQPNITSVGVINGLTVSSDILPNANVSYNLGSPTQRFKTLYLAGSTIDLGGTLITVASNGEISVGNAIFSSSGNISGANISGQVANANIADQVYTNAQPNITSLGTLSSLSVTGGFSAGDTTITGNLTVGGTTTYVNATNTVVEDPVIALGSGANGAALIANDGFDRGLQLHYYTTQTIDAFMGWKNSAGEFVFASNANVATNNAVTINTYGNIHAGNANLGNLATSNYFSGSGNLLSNIQAANITGTVSTATTAATVTTNAQPNITSVGTLASLNVTGNISSAANITASYYIGNGSQLTGVVATTATTVTTNAQPNITSVGTLASLNVTGNISTAANITSTNAILGNLATSNYFTGNGSLLTSITGANVTGVVANATYAVSAGSATTAATVTTNAQPNITSVGTLASLNVTGNITSSGNVIVTANVSSGNATLGNLATSNYFTGNGSLLTSITGANVTGVVANATYAVSAGSATTAATVTTNAQPNITSVGTLSSLIVTANVTANYFIGNGSALTSLTGANVTGTVPNATTSGTVIAAIQSNITSVGTLASLNVTGNISTAANVTANYFIGNGSALTSVAGANVTGTVPNATTAGTVIAAIQSNITSVGTLASLNVTGNISTAANITSTNAILGNLVTANYFTGNGSLLSGLNASNIASGTIPSSILGNSTVYVGTTSIALNRASGSQSLTGITSIDGYANTVSYATQSNITAVGTLASLNVTGNISTAANITSNNAILGNLVTSNYFAGVLTTNAQPNITSVGTLNGLTVAGTLTVTGTTEYVNSTTVYIEDPIVQQGGGANGAALTSNDGYDRGLQLHYYTTKTVDAFMGWKNSAGEFVFSDNASVSGNTATINTYGNIHSGNANLGNLATSNYFTGNGSLLSSLTGANVTGTVPNATTAGTVIAAVQSNITSVGTLASLNVTGNISTAANITSNNAILGNLATANYFTGNGSSLTGLNASNLASGTIPSSVLGNSSVYIGTTSIALNRTSGSQSLTGITSIDGYANTVSYATQSNITSVGTLASLNVTGNISTAANVTASYFIGNGSQLTGLSAGTSVINGNSNVTVGANANITTFVTGNTTSQLTIANGGINVAGYANIVGNANVGNIGTAGQIVSSIATGTAPFVVTSTTQVANLNVATAGSATTAATVTTNAQPNITSVGTLASLNVTGAVKTPNISDSSGTNAISTYYGSKSGDVGITGNLTVGTSGTGNLSSVNANLGNLATSNYFAGTLTTAAQPNITSVGTLASLNVTGNISSASNITASSNIFAGAMYPTTLFTNSISAATGSNISLNSQNLTSVGNLFTSGLTATGNVSFTGNSVQIGLSSDRTTYAASSSGGTVTLDVTTGGPVWYYGAVSAAFTANFTNIPTTDGYTTVVALAFQQTAIVPAVNIAGTSQTIHWLGGSAPTGNASSYLNLYSFTLMHVNSSWLVFGQQALYN